jgi:Dolichyl-phosphate-mannose-protein mannosyltransferase
LGRLRTRPRGEQRSPDGTAFVSPSPPGALRRVPIWIWLAALVATSAVFRAVLASGIKAPFIMIDELVWAELARGIADSGKPLVRDVSHPGYGVVYPLVISPAYLLFARLPSAYAAVKDVNAVVMSLAAVPAYLLARRVVEPPLALLAGLLTLVVPSLAYTGTVMTENLFYPLFLVVALVLVLVLEQPTMMRVIALLALIAIAFGTRVQAVAIVPAAVLAPFVLAFFGRISVRATIARYRSLYRAFVALGALVLVVQVSAGRSPSDLLGAYSPVSSASYDLGESLRYLVWHVEELVLYLLIVPVAAVVVLLGRVRSLGPRLQGFLAALVALTVSFVPIVAVFASRFSDRIEERNLFYLAPLFVIALLAWIEIGTPRPPVLTSAALAGCVLLVLLFPFHRFLTTSAITDTLMLLPWWSLQDHVGSGWIRPLAVALALVLSALFLLVPRRYALALPAVVFILWGVALKPIWWGTHGFERFSRNVLFQGIRVQDPDWIDRSLPKGAEAAFVWTGGRTDRLTVNENEFFNRSVGPVYDTATPTPGGLPETRIRIDPRSGLVTLPGGMRVDTPYLVSDSSFEPDGRPVARDKGWGVTLWQITTPLISAVRIDGLYPNDTWSGKTVTWTRRRCTRGSLLASVSSDPSLFRQAQEVSARTNDGAVANVSVVPSAQSFLKVPVAPAPDGTCRVVFTVTPTAIPHRVDPRSTDRRVLGAHFNRFLYQRKPG